MSSSSSSSSPTKPSRPFLPPSQPVARPLPPAPPNTTSRRPLSHHLPPLPLLLTVRFSTSLPDLQLDISRPGQTTVASLKHLIRARLDAADAARRLRFIHSGKILPDSAVLGSVLRALTPPPPPTSPEAADPSGKGKAVAGRDAVQRVFLHCSIGDELSDAELAAEKRAAETPAPTLGTRTSSSTVTGADAGSGSSSARPTAAGQQQRQQRTPRGFDRLLAAGFTAAEVNALRLQFRSIQASRHTPDTMPSPDTLRGLEDAWIDDNNGAGAVGHPSRGGSGGGWWGGGGSGGDEGGDGGEDGVGISGLLDILLRGMMIGFLWPLGSFGWLVREEGIWSRRWQVFVSLGCILSLTIGMIRAISGG